MEREQKDEIRYHLSRIETLLDEGGAPEPAARNTTQTLTSWMNSEFTEIRKLQGQVKAILEERSETEPRIKKEFERLGDFLFADRDKNEKIEKQIQKLAQKIALEAAENFNYDPNADPALADFREKLGICVPHPPQKGSR